MNELQENAGSLGKEVRSRKQQEIVNAIGFWLPKQSFAEWRSFLDEICGDDGMVVEGLHLLFTFDLFHNLHFGEVKTFEDVCGSSFVFYEIHSYWKGPPGLQK